MQDCKAGDNGESLNVSRGRNEKREHGSKGKKSRSISKNGDKTKYKCFHCQKPGHLKNNCPESGNKDSRMSIDSADIAAISEGYESAGVLCVSSTQTRSDRVLLVSHVS